MGAFIDETNKVHGRLTALYRVGNTSPAKWHCRCICGNELDVLGTSLRNGNTQSCGCLQKERATASNIARGQQLKLGDKFNHLTILQIKPKLLLCQCDCGKVDWFDRGHVLSGHTKTCGCLIGLQNINYIDERGHQYGLLTVIEEAGRDLQGRVLWRCQCECGHEKIVLGKTLRAGLVNSCGCLKSKGEWKIAEILNEMHIPYQSQYTFKDLKSGKNGVLFVDFYLPKNNCVIEYQGIQHYPNCPVKWWMTEDNLKESWQRDELKRQYFCEHQIRLIEIPYTDYNKLSKEYIQKVVMQDGSYN